MGDNAMTYCGGCQCGNIRYEINSKPVVAIAPFRKPDGSYASMQVSSVYFLNHRARKIAPMGFSILWILRRLGGR